MAYRKIAGIAVFGGIYGFAIGSVYGPLLGLFNVIKFPVLILTTALICSLAYYVLSKLVTDRLTFRQMQTFGLSAFCDTTKLLASIAPVSIFLAWTFKRADHAGLNEYPYVVGINVAFIAAAGGTAVVARTIRLVRAHGLSRTKGILITTAWLSVSLLVGAQGCWYLRPWFGISAIPEDVPFILGKKPDFRGATSFYEAAYYIFDPPPGKSRSRTYRW